MVLIPIRPAPLLSMTSGGLPATKRGCKVWATLVVGVTFTVTPDCFTPTCLAANSA
jgi:hypothetical protein